MIAMDTKPELVGEPLLQVVVIVSFVVGMIAGALVSLTMLAFS